MRSITIRPNAVTHALVALAAVVATCSLAVPALAGEYAVGSAVTYKDWDYTAQLSEKSGAGKISLCAIDMDGDGAYDAGEPLIMDIDSASCDNGVEAKDIRLSSIDPEGKIGAEIQLGDPEYGRPTIEVAHAIKYFDVQGEGAWEEDNVLYIDIMNLASNQVGVGDFRISPVPDMDLPAMQHITSADPDTRNGLSDLGGGATLETANMVFKTAKAYYLNPNLKAINTAKFGVDDEDVRFSTKVWYADAMDGAAGATGDAPNVTALEARIAELEAQLTRIDELEAKVAALEAAVADLGTLTPSSTILDGARTLGGSGDDKPSLAAPVEAPGIAPVAFVVAALGLLVFGRRHVL